MTPKNIELTIEQDSSVPDAFYQAYLIVGEIKTPIGFSRFYYDDCRLFAERLVEEFAKQDVNILHSKIYDLSDIA